VKWWHRQRAEREYLDGLIKTAPPSTGPTEAEKGEWNFTAPERVDEAIAKEQAVAEEAAAKGLPTFTTEPWVLAAREHQGVAYAEVALDAVNLVLDPVKDEEEEKCRAMPIFVRRVGVANEMPLPVAHQNVARVIELSKLRKKKRV
jgi:hypothetical protein